MQSIRTKIYLLVEWLSLHENQMKIISSSKEILKNQFAQTVANYHFRLKDTIQKISILLKQNSQDEIGNQKHKIENAKISRTDILFLLRAKDKLHELSIIIQNDRQNHYLSDITEHKSSIQLILKLIGEPRLYKAVSNQLQVEKFGSNKKNNQTIKPKENHYLQQYRENREKTQKYSTSPHEHHHKAEHFISIKEEKKYEYPLKSSFQRNQNEKKDKMKQQMRNEMINDLKNNKIPPRQIKIQKKNISEQNMKNPQYLDKYGRKKTYNYLEMYQKQMIIINKELQKEEKNAIYDTPIKKHNDINQFSTGAEQNKEQLVKIREENEQIDSLELYPYDKLGDSLEKVVDVRNVQSDELLKLLDFDSKIDAKISKIRSSRQEHQVDGESLELDEGPDEVEMQEDSLEVQNLDETANFNVKNDLKEEEITQFSFSK